MYLNKDGSIKNHDEMLSIYKDGYDRMVTISPSTIYQKLFQNIEQNINDMVIDGKRRGIGPVVRFNKFYENNSPRPADRVERVTDSHELALQLGIDKELLEIEMKKG